MRREEDVADLVHRVGWTFVEAFTSAVVVGSVLDLDAATWKLAALSAGASALTVVKEFARRQLQRRKEA